MLAPGCTGPLPWRAGRRDPIAIDFRDPQSSATVSLTWSTGGAPQAVIPQTNLFPPDAGSPVCGP